MVNPEKTSYSHYAVSFRLYADVEVAASAHSETCHGLQCQLAANEKADHGLRFTKFFGRWAVESRNGHDGDGSLLLKEFREKTIKSDRHNRQVETIAWVSTDPLLDWLSPNTSVGSRRDGKKRPKSEGCHLVVGDGKRLEEYRERMLALQERCKGQHFTLLLQTRLITGIGLPHPTENGFLFHPTLAVPYLRGAALKQVARDQAEMEGVDSVTISRLFGDIQGETPGSGTLAFLDALPCVPVELIAEQLTPHYSGYYGRSLVEDGGLGDLKRPADWHEPVPVSLLGVEAQGNTGQPQFHFTILPLVRDGVRASEEELRQARRWLEIGLDRSGIGAKTSLGFGRFVQESDEGQILRKGSERLKAWHEADKANAASMPRLPYGPTPTSGLKSRSVQDDGQVIRKGTKLILKDGLEVEVVKDHRRQSKDRLCVFNIEEGEFLIDESEIALP